MGSEKRSDDADLSIMIGLLTILAAMLAGFDLWLVVTGQANINKHWPFFLPAVLCGFICIVRIYKTHLRKTRRP